MQGKIKSQCLVYTKKEIVGDRTSKFVPTGQFLEKGEDITVEGLEEDPTGKFLLLSSGTHKGKYVDQSYTNIELASA